MIFTDTIAAIATPFGVGGIGVIRISGPEARKIAQRIFSPLPSNGFLSHHQFHGKALSPESLEILDEVLLTFFEGPHSFTGEDTLEISCHGSPLILQTVLEAAFRAGARPAEKGEFTRRAYLNNRLDLAQAEAVNDLITARTRQGAASALERLEGRLSRKINEIEGQLIDLLARIEASIDFTAEDGVEEESADYLSELNGIMDKIRSLAATYRQGKIERTGFRIVIAGRPNAGKSSLLNRLLGARRAIVAPQPGTTRDFIEETADIAGIPVRLTDTAGLRTPADEIEKEGIDFLWEKLEQADAVLYLVDGSRPRTSEDADFFGMISRIPHKPLLLVLNKSDLPSQMDEKYPVADQNTGAMIPPAIRISAKYGDGIETLAAAIRHLALNGNSGESPSVVIAHAYQKAALEKAHESLHRATEGLSGDTGMPPELVAFEIHEAIDSLGEITGKTSSEDILDHIFSHFCIGK